MTDVKAAPFDLKELVSAVEKRPAPGTCEEIARLFSTLPLYSSFINKTPRSEQKKAFELLKEKVSAMTAEEIRFLAEIYCGKYHRIRNDGDVVSFQPEKAVELYRQYYEMTGCAETKYILDNFEEFRKLCGKSISRRQRKDDMAPYLAGPLSTSRDPDSTEWKN